MKLSGDIGHGLGKFYNGQDKVLEEAVLGEIQGSLMGGNNRKEIKTEEGAWSVSSTAMTQSLLKIRGQDETWPFSSEYRAFCLYGISEFVSPQTDKVVVDWISGLPISDYKRNREEIAVSLKKTHRISRPNRRDLAITLRNVEFLPQGFAPARPYMINGNRVGTLDLGSRNIGFNTFDDRDLIENQTDSRETGAFSTLAEISKRISEKYGRKLHQLEVVNLLEKKTVRISGQSYDISEIVDYQLNMYYKMVETLISEIWGNAKALDYLLLFGGGAFLVGDKITKKFSQAIILDDPLWATALAQYEYAQRIFK